jgi:glycosyltransferase involved in cell wall biosynthesis
MNVILDISRFISRAHLPFDTGIDRVERAAILDALARFHNAYFVGRVGKKYVLLNHKEMQSFVKLERSQQWPKVQGTDLFRLKLTVDQRRVRTGLRDIGVAALALDEIKSKLTDLNSKACHYLNFGHSNLNSVFFNVMHRTGARSISVFLHDVIPMDFPQYCRADKIASFKSGFDCAAKYADHIFCNSNYTSKRIEHYITEEGDRPDIQKMSLVSPMLNTANLTPRRLNDRPTFAMLGTIEPRKNLGFLLDVWDDLGLTRIANEMPNLIILGKRGWESDEVLARLDEAIETGFVFELSNLNDTAIQEYLINCHALLFPSHVEGYGLPAQEALLLGVPVIGSNIPVFQELFEGSAELLPTKNTDAWINKIEAMMQAPTRSVEAKQLLSKSSSWTVFFDNLYKNPCFEQLF